MTLADIESLTRNLVHNHSMTNFAFRGVRPQGECRACDYAREGWQKAVEDGR